MGDNKKPEAVSVTFQSRDNKHSKSVTLYNVTVEQAYKKVMDALGR